MRTALSVLLVTMTVTAAVKIEKTPWKGWQACYRISNGTVEMIVPSEVGPRIMYYGFTGGKNLFKEFASEVGGSGEKEYKLRGGHRLWVAPEDLKTSWALDNDPVKIAVRNDVLVVTQNIDSAGLVKEIEVRLDPQGTRVRLVHRTTNHNEKGIELAPWTLTMMAPGGRGITGFPPRGKHPEALVPTNPLVMWAYTNLADPRWGFTRKYLTLRQDPAVSEPQKIGLFNKDTWAAYLLDGDLFIKRTTADPSKRYPDMGCSFETFTNADMLELETLGPLTRLGRGQTVEHVETWSLHRNVRLAEWTDAELDRVLLPLLER